MSTRRPCKPWFTLFRVQPLTISIYGRPLRQRIATNVKAYFGELPDRYVVYNFSAVCLQFVKCLFTFFFRESDVPNVVSNVMKNARICSMQTVFNVSFFPNICYTYLLYFYFWCKNSNPKIVFNYNEMVILFFFVRKFKLEGFAVLV